MVVAGQPAHGRSGLAVEPPYELRRALGATGRSPGDVKGMIMEQVTFDALTRQLTGAGSSRRHALRALKGVLLVGMLSRLGLAEGSEAAGRHRKRRGRRDKKNRRKGCSAKAAPQCPPCHDPRCNADTGQYSCHYACGEGLTCCNGQCEPPCDNGCERKRNQTCRCELPPAGTRYCAAKDQCVSTDCPSGTTFDVASCTCRCPDARSICPADNQCCEPESSCTQDGCCPPDHLCERGGVTRCCY